MTRPLLSSRRLPIAAGLVFLATLPAACTPNIEVAKALSLIDVHTGWYDAGIVEGEKNKLVPSVAFKLRNMSSEPVSGVQLNAVFRRVNEQIAWGEHFVRGIGSEALAPGATGTELVLRSTLGYTGTEPRLQMLQNSEFVDAKVEIYGRQGAQNWVKLAEYPIDRQLLTE
jgi:hypothetical protein